MLGMQHDAMSASGRTWDAHKEVGDVLALVLDHPLETPGRLEQQVGAHTLVHQISGEVRPGAPRRHRFDLHYACVCAHRLQ